MSYRRKNTTRTAGAFEEMMENTLLIPDMFADQEPEHVSCLYDTSPK